MPRRAQYMPGQSMYAGAWDVLMLTLDVGCSTGLALKPPGGPSAAAAVAIVAVPAARPCAQSRRVVGVNAAADVINRKRPRIATALRGASRLGGSVCLGLAAFARGRRVTRCMRFTAMQQRPKIWVGLLAAEDWGCNPCFALLPGWESQTQ